MTLRDSSLDELPLNGLPPMGDSERARSALEALAKQVPPVDAPAEPPPMKRANYVPAPAMFNLNAACRLINDALGNKFGCYLVGSSLHKREYRDVDVRYIMDDADFDRMFPGATPGPYLMHPYWALLCTSVSTWLRQQTGLPVDFQIQRQTQANEEYSRKTGHGRHPLGLFLQLSCNPADQGTP